MDRLALGILISVSALLMQGFVHDAAAASFGPQPPVPAPVASPSPAPAAASPRSGAVLSLLLTLEALRGAPALLGTSKV